MTANGLTRDEAILAALPLIPTVGWTRHALPEEARDMFPGGAVEMVEAFCDLADRRMEEATANLGEPRLSRRVKAAIRLRLEQNRSHKVAVRRALGVLALPGNAAIAARCTARTVDAIWRAAGDEASGFTWYTKRATLAAVYTSTLLYWLNDLSDDDSDSLAFLDRRLATVAGIGKLRGRLEQLSPGRLANGLVTCVRETGQ